MFQGTPREKDGDILKKRAMDMLQEQPGPNEKEAQSDVDDGDDSPSADELPIAESGALGKLPSGNLFNRVGRSRNTINT